VVGTAGESRAVAAAGGGASRGVGRVQEFLGGVCWGRAAEVLMGSDGRGEPERVGGPSGGPDGARGPDGKTDDGARQSPSFKGDPSTTWDLRRRTEIIPVKDSHTRI
jgi:hypothetical protein